MKRRIKQLFILLLSAVLLVSCGKTATVKETKNSAVSDSTIKTEAVDLEAAAKVETGADYYLDGTFTYSKKADDHKGERIKANVLSVNGDTAIMQTYGITAGRFGDGNTDYQGKLLTSDDISSYIGWHGTTTENGPGSWTVPPRQSSVESDGGTPVTDDAITIGGYFQKWYEGGQVSNIRLPKCIPDNTDHYRCETDPQGAVKIIKKAINENPMDFGAMTTVAWTATVEQETTIIEGVSVVYSIDHSGMLRSSDTSWEWYMVMPCFTLDLTSCYVKGDTLYLKGSAAAGTSAQETDGEDEGKNMADGSDATAQAEPEKASTVSGLSDPSQGEDKGSASENNGTDESAKSGNVQMDEAGSEDGNNIGKMADSTAEDARDRTIESIVKTVRKIASKALPVAIPSAGAILLIVFWWRKRRVHGVVLDKDGNPVPDLYVTLEGKDKLDMVTTAKGEFVFKNLKEDEAALSVYDDTNTLIFKADILTDARDDEPVTVSDDLTGGYTYKRHGKNFSFVINLK